jgi:hypothetical protein
VDFSPLSVIASLLVSSLGYGFFMYGKRQERPPQLLGGIALLLLGTFTSGAVPTLAIGSALLLGLWLALRLGL